MYAILKHLHVACALLSISGFALRGFWMMREDTRLSLGMTRVLPHVVDTVLLGSAIGLLVLLNVSPFDLAWLMIKIAALLCYIMLGMVAFRFGRTRRVRVGAFWLALATALYIIAVAFTKSPSIGLRI